MKTSTRGCATAAAVLALGLAALAPAVAAPAASATPVTAQPERLPGALTYLRAKSTPATGYVPARAISPSRVSTVKSNFVVTYHGFPSNARASFQRAVDLWSILVKSNQTIRIDATWTSLPAGVLGGAGPADFYRNFSGAPQTNTWYPIALANARANTDLDTSEPDVVAEFQSGTSAWYFGTDGQVPAGKLDFTTVVLHEIGHGLGITDSTVVSGGSGSWGSGTAYPFAYDRLAQSSGGTPISSYTSPSASLAAVLQSNALRWGGAQGTAADGGSKPHLYSPNPYEAGSSVAHLDEDWYPTGDVDALMTPYLDDGEALHDPGDIALGMLRDMGWTTTGAKGVAAAPTVKTALSGDQKAILGWTPALDTGRQPLTGYRVYRYDGGSSSVAATYDVAGGTTSSTSVTGLTNGQHYRFAIASKNASGVSAASAKSATITPFDLGPSARSDAFVRQQFLDFHDRAPTAAESLTWLDRLHSGATDPAATLMGIAKLDGSYDVSTRMTRLYSAYFERLPDYNGYDYWTGKLRSGSSLNKVSETFAGSSEFKNKYGSLSNTAFVQRVYQNVLHRAPDAGGLSYWVGRLDRKVQSRGSVMLNFSESSENTRKMGSEVTSVLLRAGMLRRMPTAGEYAADVALFDGGAPSNDLASTLLQSAEYDARIS